MFICKFYILVPSKNSKGLQAKEYLGPSVYCLALLGNIYPILSKLFLSYP